MMIFHSFPIKHSDSPWFSHEKMMIFFSGWLPGMSSLHGPDAQVLALLLKGLRMAVRLMYSHIYDLPSGDDSAMFSIEN